MKRLFFGVIGQPIAHSRSPAMHAAAYAALGLPHVYEAMGIEPEEVPGVVQRVREGELEGINVTVPYKRRVLEYVDELDMTAEIVGAANTLVRGPDGQVVAHNTDMPALAQELRHLAGTPTPGSASPRGTASDRQVGGPWAAANALVLGTGATARSAIVALAYELSVAEIVVRGRAFDDRDARDRFRAEVGELLAGSGATSKLHLEPWKASAATDKHVTAVVQATSAGMTGADGGEAAVLAVDWSSLPASAVALDVVYAPPSTPFLQAALAHRLRARSGLGMLARQGAVAFELWLRTPAPFEVMLDVLTAAPAPPR
jgi:shikimate dehydrogenase